MSGLSWRAAALAWLVCSFLPGDLQAQGGFRIRGQVFLPSGQPVTAVTRVVLMSEDPRRSPEYYFTDSKGWFYFQGLSANVWYRVVVETDDKTYATTEVPFLGSQGSVSVHLRPLDQPKMQARPPTASVSANQLGHQPPKEAVKAYEQALQAINQRQREQAKESLRRAIALDPDYVNAYNDLAVIHMGEKNYAEAESLLRRALVSDPKFIHSLLNLGTTLNHLQKYSEAISPLREALRLEPGLVAAHLHLGIALVETDQFKEAEQELTRAGKSPDVSMAMVQLYLGKLYARTGDFEKSISAFNAYLQKAPNAPNAAEVRALIDRIKKAMAERQ